MRFKKFNIHKESGRFEPFSRRKLLRSVKRCGLPPHECNQIINQVEANLKDGCKSRDIFKKTLKLIKQTSKLASIHYSLKNALFQLGPDGHHFEQFVAYYFKELGHSTRTCIVQRGKFVKHEVDVIGHNNGKDIYAECKFHNHAGIKNDVKISLYVKARWDDLKDGPDGKSLRDFYIVSNTAFTTDAIAYANGTGLKLLGINMPADNSFLDEIKKLKLYPITSLRKLTRSFKRRLLERNIILAKNVLHHKNLLKDMGMSEEDIDHLFQEVHLLTGVN
jgi:hypothetical protein